MSNTFLFATVALPLPWMESGSSFHWRLWGRGMAALLTVVLFPASLAHGADWSSTELHYQRGSLLAPSFAGGAEADTDILTFQHASGWAYGDNFFFIDFLSDNTQDGFNDTDFYGELYVHLSLGKTFGGGRLMWGPVQDIGLLAGVNAGADADVLKFLPGVRISWAAPGFAFLNLDMALYIDASRGAEQGGAPREDDSYYVDINWAYPFQIGGHRFSLEGHIEYVGERKNEFGDRVFGWVLAQPQLRYDLGSAFGSESRFFVGVEWQYWMNKLGDDSTDENSAQFLFVWRL